MERGLDKVRYGRAQSLPEPRHWANARGATDAKRAWHISLFHSDAATVKLPLPFWGGVGTWRRPTKQTGHRSTVASKLWSLAAPKFVSTPVLATRDAPATSSTAASTAAAPDSVRRPAPEDAACMQLRRPGGDFPRYH